MRQLYCAAATACINADIAASRVMAYPRSVDLMGLSLMIVQNQGVVVGATVDRKLRRLPALKMPASDVIVIFVPAIRPTALAGGYQTSSRSLLMVGLRKYGVASGER